MAVRSGAGTGVVVSLVVFILTTLFLLILSIVFYLGQTKAIEAGAAAEKTRQTYIDNGERNNPTFKQFEDAAKSRNESVMAYVYGQVQDAMQLVDGSPTTTVATLTSNFRNLGVEEGESVRAAFMDTRRALGDRESEIERLQVQLKSWEDENAELNARLEQLRKGQDDQKAAMEQELSGYRDSVVAFQQQLDDTVAELERRVDRLTQNYDAQVAELQTEIDQLSEERVVYLQRIDDLESKVRQEQIKTQDPSLLVDGRVIDSAGPNDEVFIDRGRRDHIVQGMTFEVYDDAAALQQVDQTTGAVPRGKASLQVIKVGETTSTCKVVRSVLGRPVIKNDVIANAVYDPNYTFKFLVHGKFDVNGDGQPTEAEAEYIRSLVLDWGGQVVEGEELPGDLDFLVLGVEPPATPRLREGAPRHEMELWVQKKQARQTYNRLQQQATDAQIPVLNANRFFVLTGYIPR